MSKTRTFRPVDPAIFADRTANRRDAGVFHLACQSGLYQSFLLEDAFGLSSEFVWFENFTYLFSDDIYLGTFKRTAFFSFTVAFLAMGTALILAAMVDRIIKGVYVYRTLLIWPYAVAPVVGWCLVGFHV